ncbi:MAG: hypothetical protein K8T25_17405, partial [Planctomycetia bacterium]|nr:hypothetical protein [Planctomycetia bacterium]
MADQESSLFRNHPHGARGLIEDRTAPHYDRITDTFEFTHLDLGSILPILLDQAEPIPRGVKPTIPSIPGKYRVWRSRIRSRKCSRIRSRKCSSRRASLFLGRINWTFGRLSEAEVEPVVVEPGNARVDPFGQEFVGKPL